MTIDSKEPSSSFPVYYYYRESKGTQTLRVLLAEWGAPTLLAYIATPAVFGALHSIAWHHQ